MELWIRSQDKEILKRVDGVSILFNKFSAYKNAKDIDKEVLKGCIIDEANLVLGIYSTEKQALEVLDEIQNLLTPTIEHKMKSVNNTENVVTSYKIQMDTFLRNNLDHIVYQMPEDKGGNYGTKNDI